MSKVIFAICLTLLLATVGNANAALVVYSDVLNGSSTDPFPDPFLPLAKDGILQLNQFDPSLGTLNSVTLDLNAVFNYTTKFENKSPTRGSTVTKSIDQQLTIGGTLLDTGKVNYSRAWNVGIYDGTVDYAGTSGFTLAESSGATNAQLILTGAEMASFIGSGNLPLDIYSHASFSGGFTAGNGSFINSQTFKASATVTYDYTPVPIPGAAWLLATGLIGLVGVRRKIKN